MDLALNNLQRLICHKTQQTKPSCNVKISENKIMGSSIFQFFLVFPLKKKFQYSKVWYE